jgi:hypothetical protein
MRPTKFLLVVARDLSPSASTPRWPPRQGPQVGGLVATTKKNIHQQYIGEQITGEVAKQLLADPQAVSWMKSMGIDVDAALKDTGERQISAINSLKSNTFDVRLVGGGDKKEPTPTPVPGGSSTNREPGQGHIGLASGGVVGSNPVLSLLHPREVVLNEGQQGLVRAIMAALAGGGGGGTWNVAEMNVQADDPRAFMQAVQEMINT